MKSLVIVLVLLVGGNAFAEDKEKIVAQIKPNEIIQVPCAAPELIQPQKVNSSKSGCCSWHGGVCGCQAGSAVCCDGTLSPSCGCKTETQPTETK